MSTANESPAGAIPATFSIGQNYPNPFSSDTVIPFELREAGHITVNIYNVTGQWVAALIDQTLPAGPHQATWRSQDQPAGLYFYRISVNGIQRHKIMSLIR